MKYKIITHSKLFLNSVLLCFIVTTFSFDQTNKQKDSIINSILPDIYKNPDAAIQKTQQIIKNAGDDVDFKIKAYLTLSTAYSSKRDYEKSLLTLIQANKLLKFSKNDLLKITVINKTAILYHQLKVYDKSIQYLDQSEQLMLSYPIKDSIHSELGKNYVVRGFIYKDKLSVAIAIDFFNKGILELTKSNIVANNAALSIAKYNKGNCYLFLLNDKLAKENFKESYEHAKILNAKSLQAFALKGLAKVYTFEGKYAEANKTLEKALSLSEGVNDLVLNNEIYKGLSENYLALNEWEKFTDYHTKQLAANKMIKDNERKSISESLKDKEKNLGLMLESEISKFYLIMGCIVLFSIVSGFLFSMYLKKKKKELVNLNLQIQQLQTTKQI